MRLQDVKPRTNKEKDLEWIKPSRVYLRQSMSLVACLINELQRSNNGEALSKAAAAYQLLKEIKE